MTWIHFQDISNSFHIFHIFTNRAQSLKSIHQNLGSQLQSSSAHKPSGQTVPKSWHCSQQGKYWHAGPDKKSFMSRSLDKKVQKRVVYLFLSMIRAETKFIELMTFFLCSLFSLWVYDTNIHTAETGSGVQLFPTIVRLLFVNSPLHLEKCIQQFIYLLNPLENDADRSDTHTVVTILLGFRFVLVLSSVALYPLANKAQLCPVWTENPVGDSGDSALFWLYKHFSPGRWKKNRTLFFSHSSNIFILRRKRAFSVYILDQICKWKHLSRGLPLGLA